MTLLQSVKRQVAGPAKEFLRRFSFGSRLAARLSPYLPTAVCIDVGASYYPHTRWRLFLDSPGTHWVAVEPNVQNLGYIKGWPWRSKVSTCTTGLSREGGARTLYVTNVDSGSSLLEPVIPASMTSRVRNLDYFFPVRPQSIQTLTLAQVIEAQVPEAPVFVKLDTQGAELSILMGAEPQLKSRRIVGIESELTMLADPIMKGAGKFWQACEYLEGLGFELLHVKPIYGPSRFGRQRPRGLTFLNECDAVFALRQDLARTLGVEHRLGLIAFYLCNHLFEEALAALQDDTEAATYLGRRGCDVEGLMAAVGTRA